MKNPDKSYTKKPPHIRDGLLLVFLNLLTLAAWATRYRTSDCIHHRPNGDDFMNQHFITQIHIDKVRHLQNITIPLSETTCKHLILTGKNGSGKTSVMEALKAYLSIYTGDSGTVDITRGVTAQFNDKKSIQSRVYMGKYIFAYYEAERGYTAHNEKNVSKVDLKERYTIQEHPGQEFVKYILNLKTVDQLYIVKHKLKHF